MDTMAPCMNLYIDGLISFQNEEVELMRQKMQAEKIQALESLKDRLIKVCILLSRL